jgi:hypothetical protein
MHDLDSNFKDTVGGQGMKFSGVFIPSSTFGTGNGN